MLVDEVATARKSIFRDGYDISLGELVSLYERKELIIQPEYQRLFRWDATKKTRFIESLLLNIPIPPIFVFSDSKGRWELVDGLQRVSTVLEFMGKLLDAEGKLRPQFQCDGTGLLPSLRDVIWPLESEDAVIDPVISDEMLPLNLQLGIRRARIRVEILGPESDAQVKYELFQRLNSGGANLSEQELRNVIIIAINRKAFDHIKDMSQDENFKKLARVGDERMARQYLLELVVRFLVLRNHEYKSGLDVHEYLDNGIIRIAEDKKFEWKKEKEIFSKTMSLLSSSSDGEAFFKNKRFSLGMYEFVVFGLSKAIDAGYSHLSTETIGELLPKIPELEEAKKYAGMGSRGSQRLANFVLPLAEKFFTPQER